MPADVTQDELVVASVLSCGTWETASADRSVFLIGARTILAALNLPVRDTAIRADERAKVRAELLAIADAIPAGSSDNWTAHAPSVLREAADRIAPDPKETT
jgi:hypothetical protein